MMQAWLVFMWIMAGIAVLAACLTIYFTVQTVRLVYRTRERKW